MNLFSFVKTSPVKALLLAGLSLFATRVAAEAAAEEAVPVRRSLPAASVPAAVGASAEDLAKAEADFKAQLEAAQKKSDADGVEASLRLKALGEKVETLEKTSLNRDVSFTASLMDEKKELADLKAALDASEKNSADSLKKAQEISENLERKGARMESLLDLMNTLKRDVNDNSHEIAEIKGALEKVEERTHVKTDDADWWEQIVTWRYLPVTAAVLGGIALGVAASR